jgi:hypothetical protein
MLARRELRGIRGTPAPTALRVRGALLVAQVLRGTPETKAHPATRGTPATTALLVRGVQPEMLVVLATPATKAALATPAPMAMVAMVARLVALLALAAVAGQLVFLVIRLVDPEVLRMALRGGSGLTAAAAAQAVDRMAGPAGLAVAMVLETPLPVGVEAALDRRLRPVTPEMLARLGLLETPETPELERPPEVLEALPQVRGRGKVARLARLAIPEHPAMPGAELRLETRAVPLPPHGRVRVARLDQMALPEPPETLATPALPETQEAPEMRLPSRTRTPSPAGLVALLEMVAPGAMRAPAAMLALLERPETPATKERPETPATLARTGLVVPVVTLATRAVLATPEIRARRATRAIPATMV